MATRVALSPNDALWLNMDTPENLMIIESVMWFDEPLDADRVRATLRTRLVARYPVFSWRPDTQHSVVSVDHWVPDESFDLANHMTVHDIGDGGQVAIQRFLEEQMSQPLPRDRPLWHAHVLNGTNGSAVIMRFHHAIADGTALVRVLLDLTTDAPDGGHSAHADHAEEAHDPPAVRAQRAPAVRAHPGRLERTTRALGHMVTLPLAAGVAATNSAVGLMRMLDPDHEGSLAWRLADQARGTADAVDKLVVASAPDALPYGRPGRPKRAGWTQGHDVAAVKAVARANGATINDVMLAALAGGLRRYVISRGEVPRDVTTMIPVNLRPVDAPLPAHLGNKFALVAFELPLGSPTPQARIATAKARMDVIKQGPEAVLTFGLAHAIGSLGAVTGRFSRQMIAYFGNKAFGVTTNVPGPRQPRYLAGRQLVGILGWVPGASHQTLGSCVFSYNGIIRVGFKSDATVIPDVDTLVTLFNDEMADLLAEGGRTPT